MTKRLCLSLVLAIVAILLVIVPVLAACYAYIYVEESDGNSYEELPLICSVNITTLVEAGFISSTGLDTRVLTGDGVTLPHMLAEDKVLFVSDLAAYEDKTLIFYLGATSLSSFPIIVGYNGSITTDDDPDLEMSYVFEVLASGYFDAAAGTNKNILYKEGALKAWISGANTLRVATLNATEDEQWALQYSSFTSGEHVVYVVGNGLLAHLYVDNMVTAKDTENLYESSNAQVSSTASDIKPNWRSSFYYNGLYWAFYDKSYNSYTADIYYKTSTDGASWSSEYTITTLGGYDVRGYSVSLRSGYMHFAYSAHLGGAGNDDYVIYRRGVPEANSTITWSAAEQTAVTISDDSEIIYEPCIVVDSDGYPFIIYDHALYGSRTSVTKSSANNGTWSTAGGYPFILLSEGVYHDSTATSYPSSNKIYALWGYDTGPGGDNDLIGRYYNGVSWAGSTEIIGDITYNEYFNAVADDDDNVYIVWEGGSNSYLRIRYSDGTFSSTVTLSGWTSPSVSYNDDNGYVYIIGIYDDDVAAIALANGELSGIGTLFTPAATTGAWLSTTPYGDHIGIMYSSVTDKTQHGYLTFPWDWNDNSNDWLWMQNNVMSYADYIILGVDGDIELTYQPDSIIQGTTLPDEESDHDGTITWGSNPSGVDVSHSELMCEEDEDTTGYYYFAPGSQDIIKPEPELMTGDVDLERLRDNPLYPLVQMLSIDGFLNERLVWLGLAWFSVVIAMLGVHLGFDTRKGTEKPQHFVLTTITGLGLSIIFYTMGIFDLWVIIMMGILLGGAIIWERQPVI